MKKWYLAILVAVLPLVASTFVSCNDDDDVPNVDVSLDLTKGTVVDGVIYVAKSDTIKIAGLKVTNNESNKGAAVTNVNYYWDGYFYAPAIFAPFAMNFPISDEMATGDHSIDVSCTVLAVDKSIGTAALSYPVKVVESEDDIPAITTPNNITSSSQIK